MERLNLVSEAIDWQTLATHIRETTGQYFEVQTYYHVASHLQTEIYRIEGVTQNYLVKFGNCLDILSAEAHGLKALAHANIIKVPMPLCWGSTQSYAYLIMQYFALKDMTSVASEQLGALLAKMHCITQDYFGWQQDNYLGTTLQSNHQEKSWVTFWHTQRLEVQLMLAIEKSEDKSLQDKSDHLLSNLGEFFSCYEPVPSLLHGNMWLGNCATDIEGNPVVFNPATYYGDREVDLATTELFGGFSQQFYDAYQERWPLDEGYAVRKNLYNLYHILNHLNIFGGSYLKQVKETILSLLSEIR